MVRRLLIGNVATAMVLIGATPALADPPITETINEKVVNTFVDFLPNSCERGGPLYTFTTTNNRVEHSTTFDDGRVHGGVLETGTFVAVRLRTRACPPTPASSPTAIPSSSRTGW